MAGIYFKQGDALVPMAEAPYSEEALLQDLIARHPETLAGGQDVGGAWLLIKREVAVYDEDDDPSRGWLDHLFIDADGVPILVEVKRSTDTRIRRHVVGQLLDYAAGATNWKVEQIQTWLASRCTSQGLDVSQVLADHTDDVDGFWEQVHRNLSSRRLRLVFVADVIPPALRAIVEFLNEQMTQCEVIAIEIKQYLDSSGQQTIVVPTVLGQTEKAKDAKGKREVRHWDRPSFVKDLQTKQPAAIVEIVSRILAWGDSRNDVTWRYGHGGTDASFQIGIDDGQRRIFPFVIYSNGWLELPFVRMGSYEPFASDDLRKQYMERLNNVDGINIEPDAVGRRPNLPLTVLEGDTAVDQFIDAIEWALAQDPRDE